MSAPVGGFEPSADARPLRRASAVGRGTHGVADLRRLVDSHFHVSFPHRIWVVGRVGRVEPTGDGLRFALGASLGEEPFQLPCLLTADALPGVREQLDRLHDADVEDVVSSGRLARVGGLLRYDFDQGTLALVVSELDPSSTALGLQEDRRAAFELVGNEALSERQRMNICATAPVRVALVGAPGDAGVARAAEKLSGSGYDVRLQVAAVPLHGTKAPGAVARAVQEHAAHCDVVLLLRGQGRPLGLGVYDAEAVVRAVADAPVPVLTGLGAGGERTASDEVAFAALPTAEAAASWVLARLRAAEQSLRAVRDDVRRAEREAAERPRRALADARRAVDEAVEGAGQRAARSARRRQVLAMVVAGVVAVALVVAAALTGQWWLLAGLLLVGGALLAERTRTDRRATRGSRPMDLHDDDFAQVLDRLHRVREQLSHTSSPEQVHRLRDAAAQLLQRGEQILGRSLGGSLDDPERPATPEPRRSPLPAEAAVPGQGVGPDPDATQLMPTIGLDDHSRTR